MANRSSACSCSSYWVVSNGCHSLFFVFSAMLWMMLFLPCAGNDQVDGVWNSLLHDGCDQESSRDYFGLKRLCFESSSLCFPSTLVGLGAHFNGLQPEKEDFYVDSAGSCQGPPPIETWNPSPIGSSSESLSSGYVEISPPLLDWGINNLFTPSLVNLTVTNTHNSSTLHVFEPFSSDAQFYAYGFGRMSLDPGEGGVIAFIFLPIRLGSVYAHVVLQTSLGGFVISAKGIAEESPYGVEPFRGFDRLPDGRLSWTLSLFNSFNDVLYVEDVTARISFDSEGTGCNGSLVCSIEQFHNSLSHVGSFCKSGGAEIPWMETRPHKRWELPPRSAEVVVKLNMWPPVKGNISGFICIKLVNFAEDQLKTIVVPLEGEADSRATHNSLTGSVSVFFEPIVPWGSMCTLSVRNSATYLLSVVSITENSEVLDVRYSEGLHLYPGTITKVALISYDISDVQEDTPLRTPRVRANCELTLLTNDSSHSQIFIPCRDIVQSCFMHEEELDLVEPKSLNIELKSLEEKTANARTASVAKIAEESLAVQTNFLQLLEADLLILRNWRSQGTMSNLSVLTEHELLFPVVQIGTQFAKWITVHNPSHSYVLVQLVLNSGEIIDHCKFPNDSFKASISNIISTGTHSGFSLPETTSTEAIIHPFESAQIGPVLFFPSKRCTWRSSALVRNNLSGVELLSLRAFGGSHSLSLIEGSEPVEKLYFNYDQSTIHNITFQDSASHFNASRNSCVHRLVKEVHAKNSGELPLEVLKLKVSGIDCASDGFVVHNCESFSLAPGESARLIISYKTDFSAALVQRDLKLAMATGYLVIPMEASLPVNLMVICKKPLVWRVMWRLSALLLTALLVGCLLFFILLQPTPSSTSNYSVRSEEIFATTNRAEKPSHTHRNTKNARSVKKNEKLNECAVQENTHRAKEKKDSDHQKKTVYQKKTVSLSQSPSPSKASSSLLDSSDASSSSQTANLTVKVAKDKRRRRKRAAGGGGAGLLSKHEVSSSHSGNSTPSSPLSPNAFSSFGAASQYQNHKNKQEFSFLTETRASSEPHKSVVRPILPSHATSNVLTAASTIAPYARAPGSNLGKEKAMKVENNAVFRKEYTYDIWGNHFCGHLIGEPEELLPSRMSDASEGESQSFFTRDPQSLMMLSSAHSESSGHRLTPCDVDYSRQIN